MKFSDDKRRKNDFSECFFNRYLSSKCLCDGMTNWHTQKIKKEKKKGKKKGDK